VTLKFMELRVPPVLVVSVIALLMWLFSQFYYVVRIKFDHQLTIGVICGLFGVILILCGVVRFRKNNTTVNPMTPAQTSLLVTNGIYRFTRNPMYLGMLFVLIGWAMALFTFSSWLFIPVFIWYMNQFQIKPEEQMLRKQFGQTYEAYLARVRRWI